MGSTIEAISNVVETAFGAARPPVADAGPPAQPPRPTPVPRAPDLRLIIEPDSTGQGYVYTTMDRRTGEVVAQYPREAVLRMRETERYQAGAVIAASA